MRFPRASHRSPADHYTISEIFLGRAGRAVAGGAPGAWQNRRAQRLPRVIGAPGGSPMAACRGQGKRRNTAGSRPSAAVLSPQRRSAVPSGPSPPPSPGPTSSPKPPPIPPPFPPASAGRTKSARIRSPPSSRRCVGWGCEVRSEPSTVPTPHVPRPPVGSVAASATADASIEAIRSGPATVPTTNVPRHLRRSHDDILTSATIGIMMPS